jgi:hypothetical protein
MSAANASASSMDGEDSGAMCTVWHGYDVVLIGNNEASRVAEAASTTGNGHTNERYSSRRSSLREDYGWLRQINLRGDIPTIDEILDWSFDVLQFEDSVLVDVFFLMLEYYNLLELFRVDRETLRRYCKEVMKMHHKDCYYHAIDIEGAGVQEKSTLDDVLCEYHNWYHAVSCTHVCFMFLTLGGVDSYLNPIELFSIMMGALIHDLDHPGNNNDFEVKASTKLAKLYSDSVIERHSINTGLNLCQENPDLNWLKSFNDSDCEYVKNFISEIILATDVVRHGDIVKLAIELVAKGPQDYVSPNTASPSIMPSAYFDRSNPHHRLFIGRLLLHSADISNPVHSSFEVAADWAVRVAAEFMKQTEKEQLLQLPVTPYMQGLDSQYKIAKMQIGFYQFMVKPLFHILGKLFYNLEIMEHWGERNCAEYQAFIDAYDIAKT